MSQHSGGNKNSSNEEDSNGNRTPGSPDNTDKSDNAGNDINVDSIKEEKCIPPPPVSSGAGQLPPHSSPLDQMSKNREMDSGKFVC